MRLKQNTWISTVYVRVRQGAFNFNLDLPRSGNHAVSTVKYITLKGDKGWQQK